MNRQAASTVFPAKARAPAAPRPMQVTRKALVPLPHHHGVAALVAPGRSLANIVGAPLSSMQACRKGLTIKVVPDMRVRAYVRASVRACVRACVRVYICATVRERARAHVVCFHVPLTRWVKVTRPDPKPSAPKHTPSTISGGLT